jgi:glycosyltransferase involved in cell wall biosynthesis
MLHLNVLRKKITEGEVVNIVYVSDQYWPSVSGVPVSMDSFKENLSSMGHTISMLVPDYPQAAEWDKYNNSNNVFRFSSRSIFFNKENRMVRSSEKKRIYEKLNSIRPDLIHVHTEFSLAKIVIKYARKNNIPIVLTAHTNWEELINEYVKFIPHRLARFYCRSLLRRVFNKVDRIIAPTTLMASRLHSYKISSQIDVIPTGVNVKHFSRQSLNGKMSANYKLDMISARVKDYKTLMYVGRLGKEKNIKFLIDVFHQLTKTHTDIKFVIVGGGPSRNELQAYVRHLDLEDLVLFTGFVEREMLKDFYSLAHVFIFGSKVESQGLVILESMTCGTPVVAIGEMGTRALMRRGRGGFMVEDNIDLFIEKVDLLLSNPEVYASKSAEALQEAYEWRSEIMSARVLTLYEDLLIEKGKLNVFETYEKYSLDNDDYTEFRKCSGS